MVNRLALGCALAWALATGAATRAESNGCPAAGSVSRALRYIVSDPEATLTGLTSLGFAGAAPLSCDATPTYFRWVGRMIQNDCVCCIDVSTASDGERLTGLTVRWLASSDENAVKTVRLWLRSTGLPESDSWARAVTRHQAGMDEVSRHAEKDGVLWLVFARTEGRPARIIVLQVYRGQDGSSRLPRPAVLDQE